MGNTLFLRLEGPLQAWGERARWSVRDTASEPTKSGVVGLLACALGWNDDQRLSDLSHAIRMGVRCDRPGQVIIDYHTVVGGVMSAEGKVKKNANTKEPETVVSWRQYLCDASFLVAVQATPDVINQLQSALQSPQWPIYLGRRACVPSRPPFDGVGEYASLHEALAAGPVDERMAGMEPVRVRVVVESTPGQGVRRREDLLSRSRRVFGPRYTAEGSVVVTPTSRGRGD